MHILVTAGPTREYIDTVRYLSNDSSGKMGFALASEAVKRGHKVTLVHGPVSIDVPKGVKAIEIVSAADMWKACRDVWPSQDALIMAAAVADYTPAQVLKKKHKKNDADFSIPLKPTRDILASLSKRRKPGQVIVGFALEDRSPKKNAEKKLREKGLDAIVLNQPTAIGADRSSVDILTTGGVWQSVSTTAKARLAGRIVGVIESLRG